MVPTVVVARHSRWLFRAIVFLIVASLATTVWVLFLGGMSTVTSWLVTSAEYLLRFPQHHAMQVSWLVGFAILSFFLQLLIVPSGSLLLVGAGFVFGVLPAVAIYTSVQCLAIWPVFRLCQSGLKPWKLQDKVDAWVTKSAVSRTMGSEPLLSSMVLRLTPVLPSAAASGIAAICGIRLPVFFLATLFVGWVRPLFFASIGGAVKEVSGIAAALSGDFRIAPLLLVFVAMLLLLLVKVWLRYRSM